MIEYIFTQLPERLSLPLLKSFLLVLNYGSTDIKEHFDAYLTGNYRKTINFFLKFDMRFLYYYEGLIRQTVKEVHREGFIPIYSAFELRKLRDHPTGHFK